MKKITDMINDKFVIDPSINHTKSFIEQIQQFKIDVISYKDNEEIILNLYYTMKTYFNDSVVHEIMTSVLTNSEIKKIDRDYKFTKLGIK